MISTLKFSYSLIILINKCKKAFCQESVLEEHIVILQIISKASNVSMKNTNTITLIIHKKKLSLIREKKLWPHWGTNWLISRKNPRTTKRKFVLESVSNSIQRNSLTNVLNFNAKVQILILLQKNLNCLNEYF